MRDRLGDAVYWDKWVSFVDEQQKKDLETIKRPSANPSYFPQFVYDMSCQHYEQILRKYSRGDDVESLAGELEPLITLWEHAEREGKGVWTAEQQVMRHSWEKNFDFYIISFWTVGLSLALGLSQPLWERLIALIGNEGEDELLDRIIATRQPNRRIGSKLCHPLPYARLLAAVNAQHDAEKTQLLSDFIEHWYAELDRRPKKGLSRDTAMYERPYWYDFGDKNFNGGAYFGRWCVEAVAAVRAFGLDDSLCAGHPAYPGDLLRPHGISTHTKLKATEARTVVVDSTPANGKGWIRRFFKR